jgi:hypothetical protein
MLRAEWQPGSAPYSAPGDTRVEPSQEARFPVLDEVSKCSIYSCGFS